MAEFDDLSPTAGDEATPAGSGRRPSGGGVSTDHHLGEKIGASRPCTGAVVCRQRRFPAPCSSARVNFCARQTVGRRSRTGVAASSRPPVDPASKESAPPIFAGQSTSAHHRREDDARRTHYARDRCEQAGPSSATSTPSRDRGKTCRSVRGGVTLGAEDVRSADSAEAGADESSRAGRRRRWIGRKAAGMRRARRSAPATAAPGSVTAPDQQHTAKSNGTWIRRRGIGARRRSRGARGPDVRPVAGIPSSVNTGGAGNNRPQANRGDARTPGSGGPGRCRSVVRPSGRDRADVPAVRGVPVAPKQRASRPGGNTR